MSRRAGGGIRSRIVLAEDHPLMRSAIRDLVEMHSDLELVGEAAHGREALELCRRLRPRLVLMDVRMPQMDGLAATRAIKREMPDVAVLVLTSYEDPDLLLEAIEAGAAGYILKLADSGEIIDAIRRVLNNESPLSQELSALLLRRLIEERRKEAPTSSGNLPVEDYGPSLAESLASREEEVLRLIAWGQTNREIARNLLISTSTVKKHVSRVINKLEVSDRTQAAVRAVELGLLAEEQFETSPSILPSNTRPRGVAT